MNDGSWLRRVAAMLFTALAAFFLLNAIKPDPIFYRVDDFGHLAFCRHVVTVASEASDGTGPGYAARLLQTALSPEKHFPHVHPGRPVTNLFRVMLYLGFGENPAAYQSVLLLLLVLLAALLAELAGFLSGRAAGGVISALLFLSCAPVAGLLAWTSHLNLVLGLVLATAGLRLTLGGMLGRKWTPGFLLGFPLLLAALLTRETELFVIPVVLTAAALRAGPSREIKSWRRLGPVLFYLSLALLLWNIPSFRARSGSGVTMVDIPLTLQLVRVTFLVQAGTILKSLGWFLLLALVLVRPSSGKPGLSVSGGGPGLILLILSALTLLIVPGGMLHVILITLLLAAAALTGNRTVTLGLIWAAAAGLPILVYGAYAGRYAVEPLFGLCLALAPLLGETWNGLLRNRKGEARGRIDLRRAACAALFTMVAVQLVFNCWPDALFKAVPKPGLLRRSGHWGECLVRAGEVRATAFTSFAGRVPGGWQLVNGWHQSMDSEADDASAQQTLFLWRDPQSRYLRLGTYYSPMEPDLPIWALTAEGGRSWEWNRWFWRSAPIKGPGRMLPRLGGLKTLWDAAGGESDAAIPTVGGLWAGDVWDHSRLVAAIPELSDAEVGLALFNHYRDVAEALGADERQAMVLFETARLFFHEDGRCDAYEKHLLDRIAIGWETEE